MVIKNTYRSQKPFTRRWGDWQRQWQRKRTAPCELFLHFLPPHLRPCKHVLSHAFDWLDECGVGKVRANGCWMDNRLGAHLHWVGHRRFIHLDPHCPAALPGPWFLLGTCDHEFRICELAVIVNINKQNLEVERVASDVIWPASGSISYLFVWLQTYVAISMPK